MKLARSSRLSPCVNAHVSWPNYAPYSNTSQVISGMNYLGVGTVDFINPATVGVFNQLASAGIHFDLMYNFLDSFSGWLSETHNLQAAHPGAIISLEGSNEVDLWPPSYGGLSGFAAARQIQLDLGLMVYADPLLQNLRCSTPRLRG